MKFAVIGTGWITEAYIDGALDSGLWELSAVYSRCRERGLEFGKKYSVDTVFTDVSEMATSGKFDAVYIASPNVLHFDHAKAFLQAGKHVICEKPLTSHLKDTLELYKIAEKNSVILLEAIMHMHLPMRHTLVAALKKIGNISMATLDFCQRSSKYDDYLAGGLPNIFNPKLETGALMDLGIYCLYPALHLFGVPKSFNVTMNKMATGVDGFGIINLIYDDKLVCLRYSKLGQAAANTDIQGDRGTIYIESISRLANMEIVYANGEREALCGEEEKYKLMGYEAKDFHRFITEGGGKDYDECKSLSIKVTDFLEKFRKSGELPF